MCKVYTDTMKKQILQGYWDNEPIYREENAEETLKREMQLSGINVTEVDTTLVAELFKGLQK